MDLAAAQMAEVPQAQVRERALQLVWALQRVRALQLVWALQRVRALQLARALQRVQALQLARALQRARAQVPQLMQQLALVRFLDLAEVHALDLVWA